MTTADDSDITIVCGSGAWFEKLTARDWATVSAASAALLGVMVVADVPNAVLAPAFLWLLLACPGLAWVPAFGVRPLWAGLVAVLVASAAIDGVLAGLLILAGAGMSLWSVLAAVSLVCVAGWCVQALPAGRVDRAHDGGRERVSRERPRVAEPVVEPSAASSEAPASDWFEQIAAWQPSEVSSTEADVVDRA